MIIGSYPCCDGPLHIEMPDAPAWAPETCPHCGAKVWHRLTRFMPETFLEADFLREYEVLEDTKQIRRRHESLSK